MSFGGTFEFPNADYYNADLRELVRLYHELRDTYDKLKDEIQETIDYVNNFENHVDEIIDERITVIMSLYTQRLIAVEQLVAKLEKELGQETGQIQELYGLVRDLRYELEQAILQCQYKYNELIELMHKYKHSMDSYVDDKCEELKQYIIDNVTHLDRLDVINPFTGAFEDINIVIKRLYDALRASFGIRAIDYAEMQLTAFEYKRMHIKAIDYDTKAWFIFWELRQGLMRNPFTGRMAHYSVIIDTLVDLHRCSLTAKEYQDLQITALQYKYLELTAFLYDFWSRKVVPPLTAKRYKELLLSALVYQSKEITALQYRKGARYLIGMDRTDCCCGVPVTNFN